ncbi:hypothetical protein [Actinomadura rayongensis]|uniref:Uncharacterized protein n=1 Tax=Actinomadura rayongensis TaxID=1429076 RepID=A0A6I4WHN6_9ACTN|nr:hypothetical protein [Actinomadura rayongensis]MXQ66494.1 hypothetical protein [Actinomadura rayongensis]
MKRTLVLVLAGAATAGVLVAAGFALSASADGPKPADDPGASTSGPVQKQDPGYWTKERMEQAQPAPMPTDD